MRLNKTSFYLLSFTWGILLTLWGCFLSLVLLLLGKRPKRWGWAWYFQLGGRAWGGMECGPAFIRDTGSGERINDHEYGHAIQNCIFGPFMIPLVSIPSSLRYWYRRIRQKRGKRLKTAYDAVWFEGQATRLGRKYSPRH